MCENMKSHKKPESNSLYAKTYLVNKSDSVSETVNPDAVNMQVVFQAKYKSLEVIWF